LHQAPNRVRVLLSCDRCVEGRRKEASEMPTFNEQVTVFVEGTPGTSGSQGLVVRASGESAIMASTEGSTATVSSSGERPGVLGRSRDSDAVVGISEKTGAGVLGESNGGGPGVFGRSAGGFGVHGATTNSRAVFGDDPGGNGVGVWGTSENGVGVLGESDNGTAGRFEGFVEILGNLTVNGRLRKQGGGFLIDHPRDPANKYLNHSFVESPEMKNVYDGVAQLDEDGTASVDLPEWFEALNGDFRYQLTAIGGAAPNLHIAEEISENRFKIAGGEGGMKVCWQVTGSREDPWAAANPVVVEQEKPEEERGRYLEPSLYDAPEEQRVMLATRGR
jgi:hypothetical protein